jgi:hypothetical protein
MRGASGSHAVHFSFARGESRTLRRSGFWGESLPLVEVVAVAGGDFQVAVADTVVDAAGRPSGEGALEKFRFAAAGSGWIPLDVENRWGCPECRWGGSHGNGIHRARRVGHKSGMPEGSDRYRRTSNVRRRSGPHWDR